MTFDSDNPPIKKIDPEVKAQWVAALRSGDYKQGDGYLCMVDDRGRERYCCLGVLSDLCPDVEKSPYGGTNYMQFREPGVMDGRGTHLPSTAVDEWAGFDEGMYNIYDKHGSWTTLHALNDRGHTFNEIADLIEEHL